MNYLIIIGGLILILGTLAMMVIWDEYDGFRDILVSIVALVVIIAGMWLLLAGFLKFYVEEIQGTKEIQQWSERR